MFDLRIRRSGDIKFFNSWLIFDSESDDIVEIPKFQIFSCRNKVWIQPIPIYSGFVKFYITQINKNNAELKYQSLARGKPKLKFLLLKRIIQTSWFHYDAKLILSMIFVIVGSLFWPRLLKLKIFPFFWLVIEVRFSSFDFWILK